MTDLSDFKDLYLQTAKENITLIKNGLVSLSQNQNITEAIEQTHRNAHTLKSKSLMMGHVEISNLAKSIEDALYDVKNKKNTLSEEVLQTLTNQAMQIEEMLKQIQHDMEKKKI